MIGGDGTVIQWTPAAEELLGYQTTDVLGRPGTDLLMPADRTTPIWTRIGGSGGQGRRTGLAELRHRNGDPILVHLEVSSLSSLDGTTNWLLSAKPAGEEVTAGLVVKPLINSGPVGMVIWNRDLRCVWVNERARLLQGVFPDFQVGRTLPERLPGLEEPAPAELVREVLADGTPLIDRESLWTSPDKGPERGFGASLFRLEGVDERPLGVFLMVVETTHSVARRNLAILRRASVDIGTTLDPEETAQELADLAVPGMADFVVVDVAESVLPGPEPLERLEATEESFPVVRRAGLASIHEGSPETVALPDTPVYAHPSSPYTEILASGRPHFEPVLDTSPGSWVANDPDRARTIRDTGIHSMIGVPLKARGDLLGIAYFVRNDNKTPFTRDDLALAEELAARTALSLDNARQYTREHNTALTLQRHLLPSRLEGGGAVDLAAQYRASASPEGVSGDWFDAIVLPGPRVALVVGDVTGHGIAAAAAMGRLRTAVRTLTYLELPPHQVLTRLDENYALAAQQDEGTSPIACTLLIALYDPVTRLCTMSSAGHPPPALVDPAGRVTFPHLPPGTPIGLGLASYQDIDIELAEESLIALYTDGLIETRGSDLDSGMRRLGAVLSQEAGPLQPLSNRVVDSMITGTVEDDVTLLLARTRPSGR